MFREQCKVLENKKVAPGHYILKLASPRISKSAKPGQFVQILCVDPLTSSGPGSYDPLLPRPFSFLTASKRDFSILYQVVGKGTKILSQAEKGDFLWIVGPLGNGFTINGVQKTEVRGQKTEDRRQKTDKKEKNIILVGGGVGIPPLYHLAQYLLTSSSRKRGSVRVDSRFRGNDRRYTWSGEPKDIHVFLGARHKSLLLCEKDFKKLGVDLRITTDDGSKGHKGFITEILEDFLSSVLCPLSSEIFACGPTPMLKAVSHVSMKYEVSCEVSVEVPMACGFGACLGCAVKIRSQKSEVRSQNKNKDLSSDVCPLSSEYRFAIACCEGPVFQAGDIVWE